MNGRSIDLVTRYVEGDLEGQELMLFEEALRSDPDLRSEVDTARKVIQTLRSLGEADLRASLRDADAEGFRGGGSKSPRQRGPIWRWAAAAVLLLGIGTWWVVRDTPQRLATKFALEEPGLPVLMGAASYMDEIMNAYKQGDLETAGHLIKQARATVPDNDTLTYFAGIVAMRQGMTDQAEEAFDRVDPTSVFTKRACYQLAIIAMQRGNVATARILLQSVTRARDPQLATRARDLLDRL